MTNSDFFDRYNGNTILFDDVLIFVDGYVYEVVYDDNRSEIVNVPIIFIIEAIKSGEAEVVR